MSSDNHISEHRLRLTKLENGKQVALIPHKTFAENGIPKTASKIELFVKDLGPQISWRTVLVEYFGPFIFHPLFYYVQSLYGSGSFEHTNSKICLCNCPFAFLKRELETIFVHKFSNATMPAFNIFKNSGHYWILSGFNLAYFIYGPSDKLGF